MAKMLDFTPEQIDLIDKMRRDGASVKNICEATQLNPAQVSWYLNASENTGKLIMTSDGKIKEAKTDPKEVMSLAYDIIWHNLIRWLEVIKMDDSKPLPPTQLNQLMNMVSQIDRIQRLDAGTPTENYNFQVLTLSEIRHKIEEIMPQHIVHDAKAKVEELRNINWETFGAEPRP